MRTFHRSKKTGIPVLAALLLLLWGLPANALINGIGPTDGKFSLSAKPGHILTSDGDSFLMWGYADVNGSWAGRMQYPGPTLIVNEGATVTVELTNELPAEAGNVSIVFPGHNVTASGGVQGLLTREAQQTDDGATTGDESTVVYTFTASRPGTYLYRSGTRADIQVEMGMLGALIVRPAMGDSYAYNHADTEFDREFLLITTEMDPLIHRQAEFGQSAEIDTAAYFSTNWFANGRNFPDNMADDFVAWLPHQPYKFQPRMHPGEKVLVRSIGAGVELHPFHYHGNDFEVIAEGGRLLSSGPLSGPDRAWKATTRRTVPGQTADVMWTWNAEKLGWDIYGHTGGETDICAGYIPGDAATYFDPLTHEYCPDHGLPFPVLLPTRDSLTFGAFYPGTPFLGGAGDLAPGDPGLNANAGYFFMWHSHKEKELTSNDIWPGGMVTFMIVEHPDVPLP